MATEAPRETRQRARTEVLMSILLELKRILDERVGFGCDDRVMVEETGGGLGWEESMGLCCYVVDGLFYLQ